MTYSLKATAAACTVLMMVTICNADNLTISSGTTELSAGSYTYDYVSITGGELKLVGNVTITCNGSGTGYFSQTGGKIYNVYSAGENDATNGANGDDGEDFGNTSHTIDGENGEDYTAASGDGGYNLSIYANGNITLKGEISLRGDGGDNHTGRGGHGGDGGTGEHGVNNGCGHGLFGGSGGSGGHSYGGDGGHGGSAFFETSSGTINCGTSSDHAVINLSGGDGGDGGTGGNGGRGGHGGNGDPSRNGAGGYGGGGGPAWSLVGSDGGYGGGLTFRAATILDDYLNKDLTGGDAGEAGTIGTAGSGGAVGSDYSSFPDPEPGNPGTTGIQYDGDAGAAGTYTTQVTPEPATMSLLAFGGLAMLRRRKK